MTSSYSDAPRLRELIERANGRVGAELASDLDHLETRLTRAGASAEKIVAALRTFSVAAPSWAVGTGGTRFGRFPIGGEPRTTEEKIDDIAVLNAFTAANRTVSLHVPWDLPDDPAALKEHAAARGIGFDAMNSNTFQDNAATTRGGRLSYKFGSFASADPAVREAAVEHNLQVVDLGVKLGSKAITIWLADGTNYPGQADHRTQFERTAGALRAVHDHLPDDWRMFTEHKPYEPAFYATVNADWGSSLLLAQAAGPRCACLVDLGHHLPNTNIEQVVSRLAMTGRLGGFHFNDARYGDDDLTTGSVKPFQLFLVFCELLTAGGGELPELALMIDQSHNLKDPLEDLMQATEAIAIAYAQAMLVDREALSAAQDEDDPALCQELLQAAFRTDVRPLVAEARRLGGGAIDPLLAYRESGYRQAMIAERGAEAVATGL